MRLECSQALHYMLTNHFIMLSKPGHPRKVCTAKIVKRYCITISGAGLPPVPCNGLALGYAFLKVSAISKTLALSPIICSRSND